MRRHLLGLGALGLAGCFRQHGGGQIGEESDGGCRVVAATELAPDEVSALGFSGDDVLAVAVAFDGPFAYADGSATTLLASVEAVGPIELVDYAEVEADGSAAIEPAGPEACPDRLEIGARYTFRTDDGVFDEELPSLLGATTAGEATLGVLLESPAGTFDPWDWAPEGDFSSVSAVVDARWDAAGATGAVAGQAEGEDGDVAFAEAFEVGSWGSPP